MIFVWLCFCLLLPMFCLFMCLFIPLRLAFITCLSTPNSIGSSLWFPKNSPCFEVRSVHCAPWLVTQKAWGRIKSIHSIRVCFHQGEKSPGDQLTWICIRSNWVGDSQQQMGSLQNTAIFKRGNLPQFGSLNLLAKQSFLIFAPSGSWQIFLPTSLFFNLPIFRAVLCRKGNWYVGSSQ